MRLVVATPHPDREVRFNFRDGVPERDILAHLISRSDLLSLLVDDPQVLQLFHTFGNLGKIASAFARQADIFARECGWRDRKDMYAEPDRYDATQSPHWDVFSTFAFPWDRLSTFHVDAEQLIHKTWRLPRDDARERWTWLTGDLQRLFILALEGTMHDRDYMLSFDVHRVASPTVEVSFKTGTNESAEHARQRLQQLYDESMAALGPAPEPQQGGTFLNEDRLRRDVEWFYRNKIKQPSQGTRWLARAYVEQQRAVDTYLSDDQHDTVSKGIKRARKLLSEIPA